MIRGHLADPESFPKAGLFFGAVFLLLADLTARVLLRPIELSIGVVTSLVGAAAFVLIFRHTRKVR